MYPEQFFPVTDSEGTITILVPKDMKFRENRILVEHFRYRGRDIFIVRTARH